MSLGFTAQHDLHGPAEHSHQWVQSVFATTTTSTHIPLVQVAKPVHIVILLTQEVPITHRSGHLFVCTLGIWRHITLKPQADASVSAHIVL